ncbi:glycosyltransferase family 4 protein [Alkalinema sp. FACHB-956]|uniref:glycosyltransferase family 4 protein n=1 Tax=Alkalinema sp. FACHB-956 TaxID=2692768 RepID=UPI001685ED4F|nr:glycosyltransferase family 4 protein [Alkalinema sp. FACHB-956]MBD2329067.1 glycosyltransferase family 4 protein [Alkalinema sp. FACHB-956]
MKIAYLVNQYPKVSHSFIRREIAAVEATGLEVQRFSIRSCANELVDPADLEELQKTRIILNQGFWGILIAGFQVFLGHPGRFWQALQLAIQLGWQSDRGLLRHLIYLLEACTLLQWLMAAKIDHVHAHFGSNSTAVACLCHALGGPPYSFTVHGPDEFDRPQAMKLAEKVKRAKFVATISSFSRSQLYRWCSVEQWPKIQVIRCGLDPDFLGQAITPIPETPHLVCVGRLCAAKGQLLLVEAVRQLVAEGYSLHLTLVGDGELRPQLESLIQRYGLQASITITGWASSTTVQQYLQSSRALVLPSFAEGLPVVIMEALALGRPVISTYIAGIPELVEPEVCGWLIPAGSITALVNALRAALTISVTQLHQMGQAGFDRVAAAHQIKLIAQNLIQLFQTPLPQLDTTDPPKSPKL